MSRVEQARIWFGATAAAAGAGLVIQILVVATAEHSRWGSIPARLFNVFGYFTIESNPIVAVTCALGGRNAVGLRLRTVASRRPRSGQYRLLLALPASWLGSVLAAQDITGA